MNKCRLCQQIYNNNLSIIYSNRLKSLIQIILKLKGFKDSWEINSDIAVCEKCIKGAENVALFWENIPEANTDIAEDLMKQNVIASYRMENLPALTEEEYVHEHASSEGKNNEPIKLRIKLPRKRKKKEVNNAKGSSINMEPLQKRTRRCPQRYDEFQLAANLNASTFKEKRSTLLIDTDSSVEKSFNNLAQVALLRSENNQTIGTLAEVESKAFATKIRISCQVCYQVFRCEKVFVEHLKTHFATDFLQSADNWKNYSYYCKLCDKAFSNHRAVRQHFKLAHSEEKHLKCSHCEARFKYKFNLNYHISTKHIPKERFQCAFCKKSFFMRYELQIHVRTHTKERPYKCEFCPFAAAHKSNLKCHQRVRHSENSTNTTFHPDLKNSKSFTISAETFIPPANLLEHEEEFLEEIEYRNISSSTELNATVNAEEHLLAGEQLKLNETLLDRENVFQQCGSLHLEPSSILATEQTEALQEPEALLEQEKTPAYDLNNTTVADTGILIGNMEDFETEVNKTIFVSENSVNSNIEAETEHFNSVGKNMLKIAGTHESSEGFLKAQPILGVIQLDSSLLKVLPSTSLLGLKKWSKSFQSSPINQLQLVKSSAVFNNKTVDKFEMNKTVKDSTNYLRIYKPSEPLKVISPSPVNNNTSVTDPVSSNIKQTTKILPDSPAQDDKLMYISKPTQTSLHQFEQYNLRELNSDITRTGNENFNSKQIPADKFVTHITTNTEKNLNRSILLSNNSPLKSCKVLSSATDRSLLKPVVIKPPTTSLSLTTSSSLNPTVLHNKPLITNIEILPSLKIPTTLPNAPTTTTNLIKPPSEYKFQCPYCYKYFKQKSPLTKHLRTHTGEKPYQCNLCPKSYADASNYKKHKMLHKNAAEALNISRERAVYAVQSSPAYSTVSDPDPDGMEVMQTLKKFESSSIEDVDDMDIDDNDSDLSNLESEMWQNALDQALNSEEIQENIRTNILGINNAILPKSMQQITNTNDRNRKTFATDDPD